MPLTPISQERRRDPIGFFRAVLQSYFADNDWDESLRLWRTAVANGPGFREDVLWVLDWIVEHPPANLGELLVADGWLEPPPTLEEQVAWVRQCAAAFHAEYEKRAPD